MAGEFSSLGMRPMRPSRVRMRGNWRSDGTAKRLKSRTVNRARIVGISLEKSRIWQAFQSEKTVDSRWERLLRSLVN
jgi:hypothetical protein